VTKPDTEQGMAAELARAIAALRPAAHQPAEATPLFAPPFPGASVLHERSAEG